MKGTTNASSIKASATAPGKLILFGEHAVVFGQPAIAACLSDLRIKVDASIVHQSNVEKNTISIDLPDLKPDPLSIEIPLASLKVHQIVGAIDHSDFVPLVNGTHDKRFQTVGLKTVLAKIGPPTKNEVKAIHDVLDKIPLAEFHKTAVVPIVYLVNILLLSDPNFKAGLKISAKSENLPLGAGLGSSAAFSVATSAALYRLALDRSENKSCTHFNESSEEENFEHSCKKLKTGKCNEIMKQPSKDEQDVINTLAFYSETLIHGTPSGIDNTVSTYGGALQYTKTKYSSTKTYEESETVFLHNFPQLNVILTNTKVPRSTKLLVRGVKELKDEYPEIVNPILDSIGNISRSFHELALNQSTEKRLSNEKMKQISRLIKMNHSLLCALGVSHASLDTIVNLTSALYDTLRCATKLTGAGGGGCAFTFVEDDGRDNVDNKKIMKERCEMVKQKIDSLKKWDLDTSSNGAATGKKENVWLFESFTSAVGGKGVLWI